MEKEMIVVMDFGGQYNQLIARRIRECNVYCEVHSYNIGLDKLREMNPKGIIFPALFLYNPYGSSSKWSSGLLLETIRSPRPLLPLSCRIH